MNPALIEVALQVKDDQEAIAVLSEKLVAAGAVTKEYLPAVMRREKALPTGLDLGAVCVAIPHTDETQYINNSQVAIGVLKEAVTFGSMVDPHEELPVRIVFLLAMKDPSRQLQLLKYLMRAFQQPDIMRQIAAADTSEKVESIWLDVMKDCHIED